MPAVALVSGKEVAQVQTASCFACKTNTLKLSQPAAGMEAQTFHINVWDERKNTNCVKMSPFEVMIMLLIHGLDLGASEYTFLFCDSGSRGLRNYYNIKY